MAVFSSSFVETLAGAPNSPRTTSINLTVAASGAGAPANTAAPVVTFDGTTFSTTTGTWTNSPTGYTYQWRRDSVNISGATSATYAKATADEKTFVDCVVTATNGSGSTAQGSNGIFVDPPYTQVFFSDFNGFSPSTPLTTAFTGWTLGSSDPGSNPAVASDFRMNGNTPSTGLTGVPHSWGTSAAYNAGQSNWKITGVATSAEPEQLVYDWVSETSYKTVQVGLGNSSTFRAYFSDSSVGTQVGGFTFAAGDAYSLESSGNQLTLKINTTVVKSWTQASPPNSIVGLGMASGPFREIDSLKIEAANAVLGVSSVSVDLDNAIVINGYYSGTTPTAIQVRVYDAYGTLLQAFVNATSNTIGSGLYTATLAGINIPAYSTKDLRIEVRAANNTSEVRGKLLTVPAVPSDGPWQPGINISGNSYVNSAETIKWSASGTPGGFQVERPGLRGSYVLTATGTETNSIKGGPDNSVYPVQNIAGFDGNIYIRLEYGTAASAAGAKTLSLVDPSTGVAVTGLTGSVGYTEGGVSSTGFTSSTGKFAWTDAVSGHSIITMQIAFSSIPSTGIKVGFLGKTADVGSTQVLLSEQASNLAVEGKGIRTMDPKGSNAAGSTYDTITTSHYLTVAEHVTGGISQPPEAFIGTAREAGHTMIWLNSQCHESKAVHVAEAAKYANLTTGLPVPCKTLLEGPNEIWNIFGTSVSRWMMLAGCRRGYAPIGATYPATPETIYGFHDNSHIITSGSDKITDRAYSAGDKVYYEANVIQALSNRPSGDVVFNASTGWSSNWTTNGVTNGPVLYDSTTCWRAAYRLDADLSIDMWDAYDAAYTAVGRSLPIKVLGGQQTSNVNGGFVSSALSWRNTYLRTQRLATAFYYGNVGDMSSYTNHSIPGWGEADKDVLWGTNAATSVTAFCDKIFGSTTTTWGASNPIKWSANNKIVEFKQAKRNLANYCVAQGMSADAIKLAIYEFTFDFRMEHQDAPWPHKAGNYDAAATYAIGGWARAKDGAVYQRSGTVGGSGYEPTVSPTRWTLKIPATVMAEGNAGGWNSGYAGYVAGNFVDYGGATYVANQNVPAGTLPTNTTYWALVLATTVALSRVGVAYSAVKRDQRMYNVFDYQAEQLRVSGAAESYLYQEGPSPPTPSQHFAIRSSLSDNITSGAGTNWGRKGWIDHVAAHPS